jgi:hypothetical protein
MSFYKGNMIFIVYVNDKISISGGGDGDGAIMK